MTATVTLATSTETPPTAALVRLHVSPLSPEIFPIVVPTSLRAAVVDISFHQLPTFPERAYGYIELPAADADKLQKRLHGGLVKGVKVRVEPARIRKEFQVLDQPKSAGQQQQQQNLRQSQQNLRKEGVLSGVSLPGTRRVQRGWTQPLTMKRDKTAAKAEGAVKSKSSTKKSEFTDKRECLFKTNVKEDPTEAGKKRKRGDRTTTIHEFRNTIKYPTFLRGQNADRGKSTAGYDPENGWVDTEGNVVEQPRRSKRLSQDVTAGSTELSAKKKSRTKNLSVTSATKKLSLKNRDAGEAAKSSSSEDIDSLGAENRHSSTNKRQSIQSLANYSTSGSSSGNSGSEEEVAVDKGNNNAITEAKKKGRKGPSSGELPREEDEKQDEVHPLEAIFKKPKVSSRKPPGLELKIPFSFFGSDGEDEDDDGGGSKHIDHAGEALPIPQTPFTQADLRFRRQRSAAPTPDTAAPTKLLFGPALDRAPPTSEERQDSGEEASGSGDARDVPAQISDRPKRSEFAETWFWENRGDNNRAWKKRRREAAKEQRHAAHKRGSKK